MKVYGAVGIISFFVAAQLLETAVDGLEPIDAEEPAINRIDEPIISLPETVGRALLKPRVPWVPDPGFSVDPVNRPIHPIMPITPVKPVPPIIDLPVQPVKPVPPIIDLPVQPVKPVPPIIDLPIDHRPPHPVLPGLDDDRIHIGDNYINTNVEGRQNVGSGKITDNEGGRRPPFFPPMPLFPARPEPRPPIYPGIPKPPIYPLGPDGEFGRHSEGDRGHHPQVDRVPADAEKAP